MQKYTTLTYLSLTLSNSIYFCFIDCTKAFDSVDHNILWKILKEIISDHVTCLLRNLYSGQEVTEPDMEQWTGSKLGKEYVKAGYCHPDYSTYMLSRSWHLGPSLQGK